MFQDKPLGRRSVPCSLPPELSRIVQDPLIHVMKRFSKTVFRGFS